MSLAYVGLNKTFLKKDSWVWVPLYSRLGTSRMLRFRRFTMFMDFVNQHNYKTTGLDKLWTFFFSLIWWLLYPSFMKIWRLMEISKTSWHQEKFWEITGLFFSFLKNLEGARLKPCTSWQGTIIQPHLKTVEVYSLQFGWSFNIIQTVQHLYGRQKVCKAKKNF